MNIANLEKIRKVLNDNSAYRISKETGIGQTTISRWTTGKTPLDKMSLRHAIILTNLYDSLDFKSKLK